jgi:O-antigen ligase
MNSSSLAQRGAFFCLLGLAFVMPLIPVSPEMPMNKHLLFAALAGCGGLFLWIGAMRRESAPALGTPTDTAFGAFLLCTLPSALFALNPGMAQLELGNLTCFGLTYLLAIKTLRTRRQVLAVYGVVLLGGVIISGLGLQAYGRFLDSNASEFARSGYLSTDLFPHSYLAAQYLVMVFVGGVVLLLERGLSLPWRLSIAVALTPMGAYLLAIGSRGAYIAVGTALLISAILRVRAGGGSSRISRALHVALRMTAVAGVAALLYVLATVSGLLPEDALDNAVERVSLLVESKYEENNFERLDIWKATVAMVSDHALTGVGLGCFATGILPYQTATRLVPHAHNQFLQVLGQSGLIGFIGLLFLLRHAWHAIRKGAAHLAGDDTRRGPFHASVAALLAALVYCFLETPLHWIEAGSLIVILLAIMSRAGCVSRDAVTSRPLAFGSLVVFGLLLGIATPAWQNFHEFSMSRLHAARLAQSARTAEAEGNTELAQSQWQRTDELLRKADSQFPASIEATMQGTELAWARGDLRTAADWQWLGNARFPGAPFQLYNLGSLLMQLNRTDHAIPFLLEVAQRPQGDSSYAATVTLARAYAQNQQFEEAWFLQRDLVRDWRLIEEHPELLLDAVSSLLMLGRHPETTHLLLESYLDKSEDGEENERYRHLRSRLEQQREHWNRALWRGPMWTGWLERPLPPPRPPANESN